MRLDEDVQGQLRGPRKHARPVGAITGSDEVHSGSGALAQPSGDHAAIEKFLTPLASVIAAMGKAATALSQGHGLQALGLLEGVQPVAQQVTSAAKALRPEHCELLMPAPG